MAHQEIWKEEFRVKSYESDIKGRLTLTGLCNYFQESAGHHADALERGMGFLLEKEQTWVLSRMLIRIDEMPEWNSVLAVETWSKGTDGLFAVRDFIVRDSRERIRAAATTGWLVINVGTRRPQRLDRFASQWPFFKGKEAVTDKPERLPECAGPEVGSPFPVLVSDLDVNNHVNNVKYAEWVMDSFSLDFQEKHEVRSFGINYLAEAFFGDTMVIRKEEKGAGSGDFLVSAVRQSDKKEVCRSRIIWKPR